MTFSLPATDHDQTSSLFRFLVANKRFDEDTLRILETELGDREARPQLTSFLRSRSLAVIRQLSDRTVEEKLSVLDFFVCAFALLGDAQSYSALKYEGLLLRELESARYQWLRVPPTEWLRFAKELLRHGFYSIAIQACENALSSCPQSGDATSEECEIAEIIAVAKSIKEHALKAAYSSSVQAQAMEHLKKKKAAVEKRETQDAQYKETYSGSTLFRNGIKMRNARKLLQSRNAGPSV